MYKAKAVKKAAKNIFEIVIKRGALSKPPIFLSRKINKTRKLRIEATE